MNKLISLKEYLDKGKTFVIPNYQRGYIWGKSNKSDKDKNSVEFILDTKIDGFSKQTDIFLQGVTVSESDTNIELIDGQQRTVFFYLFLHYMGYKHIKIKYDIRKESENFLNNLNGKDEEELLCLSVENSKEEYQDIFFFKKTLCIISTKVNWEAKKKEDLLSYLLERIKFLYIDIPKEKAIKTFTMMNGSKAIMLPEELIKAEMLRQVSLSSSHEDRNSTIEWDINALRSRYAREWDRWLYWWNRLDVRYFFKDKRPMGLLLEYYYRRCKNGKVFSFEAFKTGLLSDKKSTKKHFRGIRILQKSFEDIYNNPIIYNLLGISIKDSGEDKYKIINYFIDNKHNIDKLKNCAKWRAIGATFKQITEIPRVKNEEDAKEKNGESKEDKAQMVLDALSHKFVYNFDGDGFARKYLLYLNVLTNNEANDKKGRKINFSVFDNQSLEHIHPKSKVFHLNGKEYKDGNDAPIGDCRPCGDEWLDRDECPKDISEHSIGNLVLLDKSNNSQLGNKTFKEKKKIFFDLTKTFRSRDLPHTISVFANDKWDKDEIIENQKKIISEFEKHYEINLSTNKQDHE
ncbi:MAG: DUF262 domain-containing protein [Bacteroidales bacterium]|nr:DUF262 domain-containing protein [Bacteroidales bacterium]